VYAGKSRAASPCPAIRHVADLRVFHLGTAFQCETPARFAPGDRGRFILKRAFRRETANRGRRAAMSSISARFAFGTEAALHERQQEDSE